MQQFSDYLKRHYPHYRQSTMRKLYGTIRDLKHRPRTGRPGNEEGAREILFPPMPRVAVYRVTVQTIEFLGVYHAAQHRR